ncbi:hypothetical protein BDQ17DRAFT_195081 [Cyathus striatus]|nr:hypothetical protein BDQ17DRAFT_195081 [Cyathus striatus]
MDTSVSTSLAMIIHATNLDCLFAFKSVAALGVQVWEYLICLGVILFISYTYFPNLLLRINLSRGRLSTKLLYFGARYIPLIAQIVHIIVLSLIYCDGTTSGKTHIPNCVSV